MKLSELMNEHREFMLRCLCLTGIKVITNISNAQGLLKLSGIDLGEQQVKEIHIMDDAYDGVYDFFKKHGFALKANLGKWKIYCHKSELLNGENFGGEYQSGDLVLLNGGRYSGQKALIFVANSVDGYYVLVTDKGEFFEIRDNTTAFDGLVFLKKTNKKLPAKATLINTMFISGLLNEVFE